MSRRAFQAAERARRRFRPATDPQRRTLAYLARIAEMETPIVRSAKEASNAIALLTGYVCEPTLPGLVG